jgi:tetratricopeptide (TPR) repeat protein
LNPTAPTPSSCVLALLASLASGGNAFAGDSLDGVWDTPLGVVRVEKVGDEYVGTLEDSNPGCGFAKGSAVMRGRLAHELFTAEFKVCYPARCKRDDAWLLGLAIPFDNGDRLAGTIAPADPGCPNSIFKAQPFLLSRQGAGRSAAALAPPSQDASRSRKLKPEAQKLFREGIEYSGVGRYEAARTKLLAADKIDPRNPDVLAQIGVTYYARGDLANAERFYRRALQADPDSTLAHYNLACVLVQQGRHKEALRELRAAVDSGFNAVSEIDADPDLKPLHDDPAFKEIRALAEKNVARAGR